MRMKSEMLAASSSVSAQALLLPLLLLCFCASLATASCPFCFNGKLRDGTCICECNLKYLPPTCLYQALDDVTVTFVLNYSAATFSSELFQGAVERVTAGVQTYFVSATDVAKFNAMRVMLTMPGYLVSRILTSVQYVDPWVKEFSVMGVYPNTPDQPAKGDPLDVVLFQQGSIIISVTGIVWLGSALVLVLLALCVESSCSSNTTEEEGFSLRRGRKRKVAPEGDKLTSSKYAVEREPVGSRDASPVRHDSSPFSPTHDPTRQQQQEVPGSGRSKLIFKSKQAARNQNDLRLEDC